MTPTEYVEAVRALVRPDDAIVMLSEPWDRAKFVMPAAAPDGRLAFKPLGLWYGVGDAWIEWVLGEMPGWAHPYVYRLDVDRSRVLHLRGADDILRFTERYMTRSIYTIDTIDWPRVQREHAAIEIAPYVHELRFDLTWYYSWDVASGCIWTPDVVRGVERLEPEAGAAAELTAQGA